MVNEYPTPTIDLTPSHLMQIQASNLTVSSGTVVFTGTNEVTVRTAGAGAGQTIIIDAPTQPGAIAGSNTTYTSGTIVITGSGEITVQSSGAGTIVIHGSGAAVAVNGGAASSGTVVLSNSNNVSFGTNASTITASANSMALAASNSTYTSGTVVLTGSAGITVVSAAQSIVISGPGVAVGERVEVLPPIGTITTGLATSGSMSVVPFHVDVPLSAQTAWWIGSYASGTVSSNATAGLSLGLAVYSRNNATSLNSMSSSIWSSSWTMSGVVQTNFIGQRIWKASYSFNLTPGDYALAAIAVSTGPALVGSLSLQHVTRTVSVGSGVAGVAAAATDQVTSPMMGVYTVGSTNAFPAGIGYSQLAGTGAASQYPQVILVRS